jgi:hypothetical protein
LGVLIGFFVGCAADFAWCAWAINRLSEDFRLRAAKRFEPSASARVRLPLKPVANRAFAPLK